MNHLISIDTETTGVNPFQDKILSIALVPFNKEIEPLQVFIKYSSALQFSTSKAAEIFNKYKTDYETKGISVLTAVDQIDEYLKKLSTDNPVTFVGHNVGFDIAFLTGLYDLCERKPTWSHRSVDTHSILRFLFDSGLLDEEAFGLEKALKYFNIPLAKEEYHTALGDATVTAKLYNHLVNLNKSWNWWKTKDRERQQLEALEKIAGGPLEEDRPLTEEERKNLKEGLTDELVDSLLKIGD